MSGLPDLAEVLAPLLERVLPERRPLLVAIAERLAAERYRRWAASAEDPARRSALLACADREEQIAARVEALDPEAPAVQADLLAASPDLAELNRSLFAGRPIEDQLAIQARGERLGAATWRAFARDAEPAARRAFLACAELEEQSAAVLEGILAEPS